jgi:hypothetical protein
LCERCLTDTADTSISLFLICDQEEPERHQHLEATCDLTRLQFSARWAHMAKYIQYLFNLQHNTDCIIIEQCAHLNAYEEQATHTSREAERMGRKNHILRQGAFGITEKYLELQVAYHHLSEVEHRLNFTRSQLELAHKEVDTRTHSIV